MLTFTKLGKKGKLGNQLFQIASTIGLAETYSHSYSFPEWEYEFFFNIELPKTPSTTRFVPLKETKFNFYSWEIPSGNYEIEGWLQSEKYFGKHSKEFLSPKQEVKERVVEKWGHFLKNRPILVSVRRGDFVRHPFYHQLSYKFYILAITKNFPDWKERNIIFTSDDLSYCKFHFGSLPNAFFLEGADPIEQLSFAQHCNDFVISNSTFSWWLAWLGEKDISKIIRPVKVFRGEYDLQKNQKDYFPERWISFDEQNIFSPREFPALFVKGCGYEFYSYINFKINKLRTESWQFTTQVVRALKGIKTRSF